MERNQRANRRRGQRQPGISCLPCPPPVQEELTDAALVRLARAGDIEALDFLLRRHWRALRGHARRQCGNCYLIEDLCQETCLSLIARLSDLRDPQAFACWIHTCLANAARHCRRKNCKKVGTPPPADGPYPLAGLSVQAPKGAEADGQFLWSVLWQQAGGMSGKRRRVAAYMLEFYGREGVFPSVQALADATHSTHGAAQRDRTAILQAWRRNLTALGFHP